GEIGLMEALSLTSPPEFAKSLFQGVNSGLAGMAHEALAVFGGSQGGAFSHSGNFGLPGVGGNRALGKRMAAARGCTGDNWTALDRLWTNESSWNEKDRNKSAGALGIPQ